jgi:hypothetical protein
MLLFYLARLHRIMHPHPGLEHFHILSIRPRAALIPHNTCLITDTNARCPVRNPIQTRTVWVLGENIHNCHHIPENLQASWGTLCRITWVRGLFSFRHIFGTHDMSQSWRLHIERRLWLNERHLQHMHLMLYPSLPAQAPSICTEWPHRIGV